MALESNLDQPTYFLAQLLSIGWRCTGCCFANLCFRVQEGGGTCTGSRWNFHWKGRSFMIRFQDPGSLWLFSQVFIVMDWLRFVETWGQFSGNFWWLVLYQGGILLSSSFYSWSCDRSNPPWLAGSCRIRNWGNWQQRSQYCDVSIFQKTHTESLSCFSFLHVLSKSKINVCCCHPEQLCCNSYLRCVAGAGRLLCTANPALQMHNCTHANPVL